MGRPEDHSFSVTFILNGSKYANINPTRDDLKSALEKLGLTVLLPLSHGSPIIAEYLEKPQIKIDEPTYQFETSAPKKGKK